MKLSPAILTTGCKQQTLVTLSEFVSTDALISLPENYIFLLYKAELVGSKYTKHVIFNFENKSLVKLRTNDDFKSQTRRARRQ